MNDSVPPATSVIWSSTSSSFSLKRPLNFHEDVHYPGVPFGNICVHGRTLLLREHQDVEILWWNYGLYVLDANGVEIPELCYAIGEKPSLESLRSGETRMVEGVSASIMHWVPGNYSHILAEHLPLVQALREAGQFERVDRILCDAWGAGFLREVLALYQSDVEIVGVPMTGHLKVRTLLAFEPILHPAHWGHDVMGRFFDTVREAAQPDRPHRKLIVSRPVGRRGFTDLAALAAALPDFEIVNLDGPMSLLEQARLFAEAELVVCGHGAALTNVVFMRPGTSIVEIFNRDYGIPTFWSLSAMRQVRYCACIDARGIGIYRADGKSEDIEVDVTQVIEAVRLLQSG